jgi:hypothetical protein
VNGLSVTYGEYPFYPIFSFNPNRLDIMETDKVDYWEKIAEQAVEFFEHKEDFMDWVCNHYGSEENRRIADGAWDLVKYIKENGLEDLG